MSGSDWLLRGPAGEQKAAEIKKQYSEGRGPDRLYLKTGSHATLVFLDNDGAFFWEHQLKVDDNWRNWFTCLRDFTDCPICSRTESKRYYVAAYTVLNLTGYKKRDGTQVQGVKQLLMVKSAQFDKLASKRQSAGGDLTMGCFKFARFADKESTIGSDWDFIKKVDPSQLEKYKPAEISMEEWLKPFDYAKLFAPKKNEDICKALGWPLDGSQVPSGRPMSSGDSLSQMDQMPMGGAVLDEASIDDLL